MSTRKSYIIDVNANSATTASSQLGLVDRSLDGIAKNAAMAGAAFFAAGGFVAALKASTAAAIEADKASRQLQFAVGGSIKYYEEFAAKIQRTTIYEDDLVVAQMAFLKSLKFTRPEIERMITTATDLAAVTGQDLAGATETLLKSYSGVTRELGKYFPEIKKLTPEELALGKAVDIVAQGLRGQAAALAATDYGKLEKAAITWGNLGEDLGRLLLPALSGVTKAALQAIDDVKQAGDFWGEFWGFNESTTNSVAAMTRLGEIAKKNRDDAREASKASSRGDTGPTPEQLAAQAAARAQDEAAFAKLQADMFDLQITRLKEKGVLAEEEEVRHLAAIDLFTQLNELDLERDETIRQGLETGDAWLEQQDKKVAAIEAERQAARQNALATGLEQAKMLAAYTGNAKAATVLAKIQALNNAYVSAGNTLELTSKYLPPPFPQILAGLTMAAGIAYANQIQGFADGGWVRGQGGSRSDSVPTRLSAGERVLSAREIALMGGRAGVDAAARGRGGGGLTIQFNGPITDRAYVQDFLIPEIQRAARLA